MEIEDDPPSNQTATPVATDRYFCHSCSSEVINVQNFKCPSCSSGFIELLEDQTNSESRRNSDSSQPSSSSIRNLRRRRQSVRNIRQYPLGSSTGTTQAATATAPASTSTRINVSNFVRRPVITVQGLRNPPPIHSEEFFRAIYTLNNQMADPEFIMSGNIGDYAVGRNGIEAIVAQLFHQMDQGGPLPLSETTFESLPMIVFSKANYPECNQCSVCWELFEENEQLRKLPCSHIYHNNCIKPWLLTRCTCPICRMPVTSTTPSPPTSDQPSPPPSSSYSVDGPKIKCESEIVLRKSNQQKKMRQSNKKDQLLQIRNSLREARLHLQKENEKLSLLREQVMTNGTLNATAKETDQGNNVCPVCNTLVTGRTKLENHVAGHFYECCPQQQSPDQILSFYDSLHP